MTLAPGVASPRSRATWLQVLLAAGLLVDVLAVLSGFAQLDLLGRAANGVSISEVEAAANDSRYGLIGLVQLLTFVATAPIRT